ncbi:MAG: phospholipase D family protein [Deltaproteobacteria bacterium]|nr:phospholipase D family protein [Deltaproteobacteria bacterium]
MDFIANALNGKYINLPPTNTPWVKIAVAYASDNTQLLSFCLSNKIPLTFWCRYDNTVPVSLKILEKFLTEGSSNFTCKLVQNFHSKVIWYADYGVYIGSANLTKNGWEANIESGLFLTHKEIISNNLLPTLEDFFLRLDSNSHPLTREAFDHLANHKNKLSSFESKEKQQEDNNFWQHGPIKKEGFLISRSPEESIDSQKKLFLKEWYETLQITRNIAEKVSLDTYRPSWVPKTTPKGVQVDQFLHAYYYNNVFDGNRSMHEQFYNKHNANPEAALGRALCWWQKLTEAPDEEDIMIREWAPFLSEKTDKVNLLNLSEDDFCNVCARVHAIRNHATRVSNRTLGIAESAVTEKEYRIELFARWLYKQHSEDNKTPLDVIYYVLHGGNSDRLPERLWTAINDSSFKIPHLGLSCLGEITGWALPDKFPPRNGRTSKALKSLGFNVKIYSEK